MTELHPVSKIYFAKNWYPLCCNCIISYTYRWWRKCLEGFLQWKHKEDIENTPYHGVLLILRVGKSNQNMKRIMSEQEVGECNNNDKMVRHFCQENDLQYHCTIFMLIDYIYKITWNFQYGHTKTLIDHVRASQG